MYLSVPELRSANLNHLVDLIPSDSTEAQDRLPFSIIENRIEEATTRFNLRRERFIVRWCTVACCRHKGSSKLQSVLSVRGSWLVRDPRSVEGSKQPVTRSVSREHASRAIGSVGCRGQTNN